MLFKYRIWDKRCKEMMEVESINFSNNNITTLNSNGDRSLHRCRTFKDCPFNNIALLPTTGMFDMKNNEIYNKDILLVDGVLYLVLFERGSYILEDIMFPNKESLLLSNYAEISIIKGNEYVSDNKLELYDNEGDN